MFCEVPVYPVFVILHFLYTVASLPVYSSPLTFHILQHFVLRSGALTISEEVFLNPVPTGDPFGNDGN